MPQIVIYGKNYEKNTIEVPQGYGRYYAVRALQLGAKYAEWPVSEDRPAPRFDEVSAWETRAAQVEMQNGSPIAASE